MIGFKKARIFHSGRVSRIALLTLTMSTTACVPQSEAKQSTQLPARATAKAATIPTKPASPTPPPAKVVSPEVSSAQRALAQRIRELGVNFNGDIGIAFQDIQTGWSTAYDGSTWFPQQSVSKFWVSLTALDKADKGQLDLTSPVTLTKADLTLFYQPIARQIGPNGYQTTLDSLMHRAITQSDNTCNDFVLWKAGGPDAVRAFLRNKGIDGVRFGPGERKLQSKIAGLEWQQSYSIGNNFYTARSALPMPVRQAALRSYLTDPMDGAKPVSVVSALARLHKGELLSPASTQKMLNYMSNTRTGPQRLKGGLAPGWKLAHKTGTGQVLGAVGTGYNDIGILTAPDGRAYAVAVMIRSTTAPLGERMNVMQNTVRAVIKYTNEMRT